MGRRIRDHDWAATPLGPVEGWHAGLRTTLRILLSTNHPVFVFWGEALICLYNDAYSRSLGPEMHPGILGMPGRLAWADQWQVIGPQIRQVMDGSGATWHENQMVPLTRQGRLEEVYWTYSYGPIDDPGAPGGIGGVLVLCTETTQQVLSARRMKAQEERWRSLFDQAPGFMCLLAGPEHRYEYVNERYLALAGPRVQVGRTVVECLPEVVEQGFIELLDTVYHSGKPHVASTVPLALQPDAAQPPQLRYVDFVYQPILNDAGEVTGIFVEGQDVTVRTESTRALADTLASVADAFAAFDSRWHFVYVNPAAEQLLGMRSADLLGRSHWDVFPMTVGTLVETEYKRAAAGEVRRFEYCHEDWNRWFDIRCYPRVDGGVALYFQDITAAKLADAAQQASEQRARERAEELEVLMNGAPAFIWIAHDPRCARVSGNLQAQRLVGMGSGANPSASADPHLARGRPFREFIDGRPAEPGDLPLQRAARTGRPVPPGDLTFVFDDGRVRHLYGSALPLHDARGEVRGAVAAFVDITELRDAQQRLEAREQQLRTLADNTPDILARFDRQLRHVYVNAPIERVTGMPPAAYIGKTNAELGMPAHLVESWHAALRSVFDGGGTRRIEFEMTFQGQARNYVSRLIPEPGPDGQVEHVLSIVQDVTEQRRAESAVREAERRKDEFLATLAHELRNPLAPLRTGLHILGRSGEASTAASVLTMMNRQLAHMVRLIDELLDVSRISAGKMTLLKERVALQAVADVAVEACRSAIDAGRHHLTLRYDPTPVWVQADLTRLAQVVGNLLNNAARYTPEGGQIVLSVERVGARAILSVSDNGIGIPAGMLTEVFQMFAQVNPAPHRVQGGLGIGLALAQSIVGLHEGAIHAASAGPGNGSVFTIELAAQTSEPPARAADGDGPTPQARTAGLRILVVDDNRDAADSLALLLRLDGHEVQAAYDGTQGLGLAAQWVPQVAFVDIGMPGLDGHELARRLREQDNGQRPLLVAVTGWGTGDDERRSREAGFDHHLTKPVAPEALHSVLHRAGATTPGHRPA